MAFVVISIINDIINLNKNKEKVISLEEYEIEETISTIEKSDLVFENVVGQDSLNRFDFLKSKKKREINASLTNIEIMFRRDTNF